MFGGCERIMNKLFGRVQTKEPQKAEITHCHDTHIYDVETDDSFVSALVRM